MKSELADKTAKLDSCMTFTEQQERAYTKWHGSAGSSTEAPLNMVETDFSVQNSALNDFSVKKSTLNTSLIVDYTQFGLIAVLSTAVVYLYKDN